MYFYTIILVVALNLVPADVTMFTLEMYENHSTFTRQADGGWNTVEYPGAGLSTFYVDGTKLTTKEDGRKDTLDLSELISIDKDTDWKKLKKIN